MAETTDHNDTALALVASFETPPSKEDFTRLRAAVQANYDLIDTAALQDFTTKHSAELMQLSIAEGLLARDALARVVEALVTVFDGAVPDFLTADVALVRKHFC